mmetsp:Transcript_39028/g.115929  ORF Transcript_39028/g.115929 Transcript_39028/m.115929 type:complete len:244 (+) Transcript_39028:1-732(+)
MRLLSGGEGRRGRALEPEPAAVGATLAAALAARAASAPAAGEHLLAHPHLGRRPRPAYGNGPGSVRAGCRGGRRRLPRGWLAPAGWQGLRTREFHRFLMSFSVRSGMCCDEICAQRVPISWTRVHTSASSSAVHAPLLRGRSWLRHLSRHCLPLREAISVATTAQLFSPCTRTSCRSFSSSSGAHRTRLGSVPPSVAADRFRLEPFAARDGARAGGLLTPPRNRFALSGRVCGWVELRAMRHW